MAGFAWVGPGGAAASTHLDDRLLLDGDEHLPVAPERPVPQTVDGAEPAAVMPPGDLRVDRVHAAGSLDPTVPLRADALLDLPDAPWRPLIRPLLAAVHATGHRAWLSGGAVRDIVSGAPLREVKDLDLAGTVPPGRFTDITYQTLRAIRMSEFRTTVNPQSLVCAVIPPRSSTRLIEYRGLIQSGFRFPAVGSLLAEDARYRDFSFNALLYDTLGHKVMDCSGTGIEDLLLGPKRVFKPQNISEDPFVRASIVVRAAKFFLRWRDTPRDITPLQTWIATFPPDFCQTLTTTQRNRLRSDYREAIKAPREQQLQFASLLPEPGRELVITLIGGVR